MKKAKGDEVGCKIITQGIPVVSGCNVLEFSENIVALAIYMRQKGCSFFCTTSFSDNEGDFAMYIDYEGSDKDGFHPTLLELPEFKGWEYFASHSQKRTINICLIKTK